MPGIRSERLRIHMHNYYMHIYTYIVIHTYIHTNIHLARCTLPAPPCCASSSPNSVGFFSTTPPLPRPNLDSFSQQSSGLSFYLSTHVAPTTLSSHHLPLFILRRALSFSVMLQSAVRSLPLGTVYEDESQSCPLQPNSIFNYFIEAVTR